MRALICDDCGAVIDEEEDKVFSISWHGEGEALQGELCEDCLPDEVREVLRHDTWDTEESLDI